MKILIVGDWHSKLHEEAMYHALVDLGQDVSAFPWHQYFLPSNGVFKRVRTILSKAQNKYLVGPIISKLNNELINKVRREQPEMIFFYRGTHVFAKTLKNIRQISQHIILVGYNNDDPFSPNQSHFIWRHFLKSIPFYDLMLAYRLHNLDEYRHAGAKRVQLLRSWFIPSDNLPVLLNQHEQSLYETDVVFIGHYENDGREMLLERIIQRGWKFRLFGPKNDWDNVIKNSVELKPYYPVLPVWGNDYSKALCGAKIALCFFSKLNRDTYTRRCFEIPATATFLLSEYSEDLAGLYQEGKEIEFFRNESEMLEKIEYYLTHDEQRKAIAMAGRARVLSDGHDVTSRVKNLISWVYEIKNER